MMIVSFVSFFCISHGLFLQIVRAQQQQQYNNNYFPLYNNPYQAQQQQPISLSGYQFTGGLQHQQQGQQLRFKEVEGPEKYKVPILLSRERVDEWSNTRPPVLERLEISEGLQKSQFQRILPSLAFASNYDGADNNQDKSFQQPLSLSSYIAPPFQQQSYNNYNSQPPPLLRYFNSRGEVPYSHSQLLRNQNQPVNNFQFPGPQYPPPSNQQVLQPNYLPPRPPGGYLQLESHQSQVPPGQLFPIISPEQQPPPYSFPNEQRRLISRNTPDYFNSANLAPSNPVSPGGQPLIPSSVNSNSFTQPTYDKNIQPLPINSNQISPHYSSSPEMVHPQPIPQQQQQPNNIPPGGPLPSFKTLTNAPPGTTFIALRSLDGSMKYAVDPIPPSSARNPQQQLLGPGEHFRPGYPPNPHALYSNPSNPFQPTSEFRQFPPPQASQQQRQPPFPHQHHQPQGRARVAPQINKYPYHTQQQQYPPIQQQQQQRFFQQHPMYNVQQYQQFRPSSYGNPMTSNNHPAAHQQHQNSRRMFQESITTPLPMHGGGYTLLQRNLNSSIPPQQQQQRYAGTMNRSEERSSSSSVPFQGGIVPLTNQQRYFQYLQQQQQQQQQRPPPPEYFISRGQIAMSTIPRGGSGSQAYATYGENREILERRNSQEEASGLVKGPWVAPSSSKGPSAGGGLRPPPLSSSSGGGDSSNPYWTTAGAESDNPYSTFDYSPYSASGRSINPYAQLSSYARGHPSPPGGAAAWGASPPGTPAGRTATEGTQSPPHPQEGESGLLHGSRGELRVSPEQIQDFVNGELPSGNETQADNKPTSHSAILQQYLQRAKQILREEQRSRDDDNNDSEAAGGDNNSLATSTATGADDDGTRAELHEGIPGGVSESPEGGIPSTDELPGGRNARESSPGLAIPSSEHRTNFGSRDGQISKPNGRRRRHNKNLRRKSTGDDLASDELL